MKKPIPFGKYYLLERINVGGMAEVFRAKAYGVEGFERLVAVKRILPNIAEDKEFIRMFIDEAKLAVQLNHANIAQIFDLGVVDGAYYIALEHIHGRDLRAIFDRCNRERHTMPIAQAAFIVMKVCEGLDYAHNKRDQSGRELNLVHRDVSPQNILVSFEGEVKLIDFGIAKAAGQGAKTQAGILKGKFGYMSPEQVRGLSIDRRSDVFSCGIVLYELVTGERLFVGESDFSTLEKVRNVEILPPTTYNRKIPVELERIVLKALAKDVEDRYPNAIDLHDELQAFVYTAGEFYSRKDLSSWMKKTFAQEIESETAKLESYRQLRPEMRPAQGRRGDNVVNNPRKATMAVPSVAPPPTPAGGGNGRPSNLASSARSVSAHGTPPPDGGPARPGEELKWDEEELETQIFAEGKNPPEGADKVSPASLHAAAPAHPTVPGKASAGAAVTLPLNTRVRPQRPQTPARGATVPGSKNGEKVPQIDTAKGWETSANRTPPPPPGVVPMAAAASGGRASVPRRKGKRPDTPVPGSAFDGPGGAGLAPEVTAVESVSLPEDGAAKQPRVALYIILAVALVLLSGGGVASYFLFLRDDGAKTALNGPVDAGPPDGAALADAAPVALTKEVLALTGFDLVVNPARVTVKLDGNALDLEPPMKVRNIAPGDHTLVINGPPGFFSKSEIITITAGQAAKLDIRLEPIEIIGRFESNPPGADVTLLINKQQELAIGKSPVTHKLDPGNAYDVRFEKAGYVTKTEPLAITGNVEERIFAELEKGSSSGSGSTQRPGITGKPDTGKPDTGKPDTGKPDTGKPDTGKPDAGDVNVGLEPGTLALGSKPPCSIFIDGKDMGIQTPQRSLSLPPGKHRITLINNEFGIKESFTVSIQSGKTTKEIKDFTDRINPQQ